MIVKIKHEDRPPLTSKIMRGLATMKNMAQHRWDEAFCHCSKREIDEWRTAIAWLKSALDPSDKHRFIDHPYDDGDNTWN